MKIQKRKIVARATRMLVAAVYAGKISVSLGGGTVHCLAGQLSRDLGVSYPKVLASIEAELKYWLGRRTDLSLSTSPVADWGFERLFFLAGGFQQETGDDYYSPEFIARAAQRRAA